MSKIRITIDTDNEAFEDNPNEVARILNQCAQLTEEGSWRYLLNQSLKDGNGNTVGKIEVAYE